MATSPLAPSGRSGWPAVFACFCLALFGWTFGFYGQSLFLAVLQRENGWSSSLVSSATTLYYLIGAGFLAFVPATLARWGERPAVLAGMAMLGGGALVIAEIRSPVGLFAIQIVMAGGWALTSGAAVASLIGPKFDRRRGLAISLALNGASTAGFTTVPIMIWLVAGHGFAPGVRWVVIGLSCLVVPIVVAFLLPPAGAWVEGERRRVEPEPAGASTHPGLPRPRSQREAIALRAFWLTATPFAIALFVQVGFLVHQVAFLLPRLGPDRVGLAVALTTVAALLGRLALGTVIDRLDRRRVTAAGFVLQAFALTAMLIWPSPAVLYGACFAYGLWVGNLITLPALVVLDEFAAASFGRVFGLVTATNQFVYAFAPMVLGLLYDATSGYGIPLGFCVGLDMAAAVVVLVGRPARMQSEGRA